MSRIKLSSEQILAALSAGPKTITDLAGGSRAYSVRQPIREAIDAMLADGRIRPIGLGRSRCFVAAGWRVYRVTGRDCKTDFNDETLEKSAARKLIDRIVQNHGIGRG